MALTTTSVQALNCCVWLDRGGVGPAASLVHWNWTKTREVWLDFQPQHHCFSLVNTSCGFKEIAVFSEYQATRLTCSSGGYCALKQSRACHGKHVI